MAKIKYDKKLKVYYKNKYDYDWIIDRHNKYIDKNKKLIKSSIFHWKIELLHSLNKPYSSPKIPPLNESHQIKDQFSQNLNIKSFKFHNWGKLEDWRIKILYQIDEFLQNNSLIKSKKISVQFIGSLGSFNPISFSDFDCLIILPLIKNLRLEDIFEIKKLYNVLNFSAHIFDPLQHHDIFIITEDELSAGIFGFYPIELLKKNWGYGRDYFYYPKNISNKFPFINFIKNNQYFRRLDYNQELPNNMYQLKYVLSSIYLMPAYFYNAKNKIYSKRKSIDKIKNTIPYIKKEFDWLTQFRDQWPSNEFPFLKKNILMYGFNTVSLNNIVHTYRRIDYLFKSKKTKHPFLKHSSSIIRKARIISDLLLESIIKKDEKSKNRYRL